MNQGCEQLLVCENVVEGIKKLFPNGGITGKLSCEVVEATKRTAQPHRPTILLHQSIPTECAMCLPMVAKHGLYATPNEQRVSLLMVQLWPNFFVLTIWPNIWPKIRAQSLFILHIQDYRRDQTYTARGQCKENTQRHDSNANCNFNACLSWGPWGLTEAANHRT